ncbi:MAG: DNA-binding domain-containing protein [Erythrobacter sp.]
MTASEQLLLAQQGFMAQVLDDDAPAPADWPADQNARLAAGMDVYRQNYRSAVVEAISSTYEQTQKWLDQGVVDGAFQRAAIHHVIAHPPAGWTIDDVGAGFETTCLQLFPDDRAVAELAWLEWAMLGASRAAEATPLTPESFAQATAEFGDEDWAALTLEFVPGIAARTLEHDLHAMWQALGSTPFERPPTALEIPRGCIVWREGERPTFLMVDAANVQALNAARTGMTYAEICVMLAGADADEQALQEAAMAAGAMLGQWLQESLIVGLNA